MNGSAAALLAVMGAATAAILRHRWWNVEIIVNRVIVYGGMTTVLVASYAGLVWLASRSVLPVGEAAAVAAAVSTALILHPLRRQLQRWAARLVFGDQPSTDALIRPLGAAGSLGPDQVLTTTAEVIASSLALPYVAIAVDLANDERLLATYGNRPQEGQELALPVSVGGEPVGSLTVGIRRGQRRFARHDREMLAAVAAQTGATAAMVRLAVDLQRSRHALVTAREEERRRIRRNLHDGLGPTLAGVAHRLERVRSHATPAAAAADAVEHLEQIEADIRGALDDVRRLVRGLRPPVLDQLGVAGAIEILTQDLGLTIEVHGVAPESVSAAVELATYRIAAEALTNAHRHGRAGHVDVRFTVESAVLAVEIADDGRGLGDGTDAAVWGVGLHSINERAAELGGTWTITSSPQRGSVLTASLPLGNGAAR